MIKFEEGKIYLAKLSGEVREEVEIIKRTPKFATVKYWGKTKKVSIKEEKDKHGILCEYLLILWEGVYATDKKEV